MPGQAGQSWIFPSHQYHLHKTNLEYMYSMELQVTANWVHTNQKKLKDGRAHYEWMQILDLLDFALVVDPTTRTVLSVIWYLRNEGRN